MDPLRAALDRPVVAFSGNFGSGKSEVAVNVALALAAAGAQVAIVDLDVVNPYFRCREARADMEAAGIRVVAPSGEYESADLPIILPEIRGLLGRRDGITILDVGGDDLGARALSSLRTSIVLPDFHFLMVVNASRPFTCDLPSCLATMDRIQGAAGLTFTGLVGNTHLMKETTVATLVEGAALTATVGLERSLPVMFVTADGRLADEAASRLSGSFVLPLTRRLRPPWLPGSSPTTAAPVPGRPWGTPPRVRLPEGCS